MSTSVVAANDADSLGYDHQQNDANWVPAQRTLENKSRNDTPLNSDSLRCLPRGSDTSSRLLPHEALFLRLEAQARQVQEVLDRQKAMGEWLNQLCEAANVPDRHEIDSQAELLVGIGTELPAEIPSTINSPDLGCHKKTPSSTEDDYHLISTLDSSTNEVDRIITTPESICGPPTTAPNAFPPEIEPDDNESDIETDPTLVRYAICYMFVPPGSTFITGSVADIVRQEVDMDAAFMPRLSRTTTATRRSAFAGTRTRAARVQKTVSQQKKRPKTCMADGAV